MIAAARIAEQFKIDPIIVLNSDRWDMILRSAAYAIIQDDERRRNKKAVPED